MTTIKLKSFFAKFLTLALLLAGNTAWGQTNTAERYPTGATTPAATTTGTNAAAFWSVVGETKGDTYKFYADFDMTGNNAQKTSQSRGNSTPETAISFVGVGDTAPTISNHGSRFYDYGHGYFNFNNIRFRNCGYPFTTDTQVSDYGAILWSGSSPMYINCENAVFESNFACGAVFSTNQNFTLSGTYSMLNNKNAVNDGSGRIPYGGAIYGNNVLLNGDGSKGTFTGNGNYALSTDTTRKVANDVYSLGSTKIEGAGTYSFDGGIVAKAGLSIGDASGSATNVTFKTGAINTITGDITVNEGAAVSYETGVTQTTTTYLVNNGTINAASALQNLKSDKATATVTGTGTGTDTNLTLDNTAATTYKGIVNATTLTKTGTGALSLSGTNNITGLITVEAGKLTMPMALGQSAHIAKGGTLSITMSQGTGATTDTLTVTGSGRLDVSGNCWFRNPAGLSGFAGDLYVTGTLGVGGTLDSTSSTIHLAGGILRNCEVNGEYKCNVAIDSANGGIRPGWTTRSVTFSGVISDGTANTLNIISDSNLDSMVVLTNPNNTYTNTNIKNGDKGARVRITNSGALGTGTVTVAKAANADPTAERTYLDLNGCDFSAARLAGEGEVTNMNAATVSKVTFDSAYTNTFTGNIQMVKTGASEVVLTKDQVYTGGTVIQEGTLTLPDTDNSDNFDLGSGGVTLTGGALELGIGTYDLGDITGGDGYILFNRTASGYSQIDADSITGDANGILKFNFDADDFSVSSMELFANTPTLADGLSWESLLDPAYRSYWNLAPNALGGVTMTTSSAAAAVPEPGSWILLLSGLGLSLLWKRRRNR